LDLSGKREIRYDAGAWGIAVKRVFPVPYAGMTRIRF